MPNIRLKGKVVTQIRVGIMFALNIFIFMNTVSSPWSTFCSSESLMATKINNNNEKLFIIGLHKIQSTRKFFISIGLVKIVLSTRNGNMNNNNNNINDDNNRIM